MGLMVSSNFGVHLARNRIPNEFLLRKMWIIIKELHLEPAKVHPRLMTKC